MEPTNAYYGDSYKTEHLLASLMVGLGGLLMPLTKYIYIYIYIFVH